MVDDHTDLPPSGPSNSQKRGIGNVSHHHPPLTIRWKATVTVLGKRPMLKDIIYKAKSPAGPPWDIRSISATVNDKLCIAGANTGKCNKQTYLFNHDCKLDDDKAKKLYTVLKEGTAAVLTGRCVARQEEEGT